jgi:hypothetical protein
MRKKCDENDRYFNREVPWERAARRVGSSGPRRMDPIIMEV